MNFKTFLEMYDNWNGITCVNDDDLNLIVGGRTVDIYNRVTPFCPTSSIKSYEKLFESEVVAFGFYDEEFCVRVK